MFHAQPLNWEVVESHAVAAVQVLFKDDGVNIRQIAPNEISGSYTFDMHPSRRTSPSASPRPRPKNTATEAGRPRPVSVPSTSTTTSTSTKKLHRRSRIAVPSPCRILKRTTRPATIPSKEETPAVRAPEPKPERRRSLGTTFSFLQSRGERERSGSTSSASSELSTSGTEGSDSSGSLTRIRRKEKQTQTQPQDAPTRHSTGSYFPVPLRSPASDPSLALSAPPAQPSYDKAQTKKVLKHARAELMKAVGKAGYNVFIVEGWELTVLRQGDRYRIEVIYRARPAIAESDAVAREHARVPRSPPYLAMLDA